MAEIQVSNDQLEVNEDVMMGKPVIKETRIPVEQILRKLSQDIPVEELLNDYPNLTREDISAVLEYTMDSIYGGE